ncbi:bombyxin A-1 homolog [Galleria mellonella]|uniref:Bombyxin A-1 homolog n=1 Tax=Galleria mellonella TaxID=7137 RepID=A0A6J1X5K1_GALME|nr:bombyxin A-1 homolog [Galleria mellonella]WLY76837.1 insulin-like peptide transcript variant X1 [Galleria mellonella]
MRFQPSLTVLIFFATITICCGHIGGNQISLQEVNPQMYCGRTLARTLALLCFDDGGIEKKSEVGTMYRAILSPYYKEQESLDWPWLAPHKARMGLPSRGKRYQGIVSECCDKACSINELLTYC